MDSIQYQVLKGDRQIAFFCVRVLIGIPPAPQYELGCYGISSLDDWFSDQNQREIPGR